MLCREYKASFSLDCSSSDAGFNVLAVGCMWLKMYHLLHDPCLPAHKPPSGGNSVNGLKKWRHRVSYEPIYWNRLVCTNILANKMHCMCYANTWD